MMPFPVKLMCLIAFPILFFGSAFAEPMAWPVKVSQNQRYFVDQDGKPVFWLGTTQWELFRGYKLEDARTILEKTKARGFTFAQVMLMGVGDGTKPNIHGEKPWINDDPLMPNEAYFKHVDAVLQAARENNVIISMTVFHQRYRKYITVKNARAWGKWLAQRYKDVPNIVWSMTPEAKQEFVPILRELVAGLREGDGGRHLITFKPDPAPFTSSFIHEEKWLDFNSMQVWNRIDLIYSMVTKDYNLKPVKPVLMAEGAYEHGSEYGFDVTPLWVRRQAYYSYLCGGHHTYGHNDSWRILSTWKNALDAPGAQQMGVLRKIFEARPEWWLLVPDQSLFAAGGKTDGKVLHLAARHKDGKWAMIYLADKAKFSVDLGKLNAAKLNATWINPMDGKATRLDAIPNQGVQAFTTPEGWEDSLLLLESQGAKDTKDGWQSLFDGKNLDAWNYNPKSGVWMINAQGELYPAKSGPDLTTKQRYCDFVLELDFKVGPKAKANSGVFIHVHDPRQNVNTGMEVQILDNGDYGVPFNAGNANGALYDLVRPAVDANKPVGEWNHFRITVDGPLVAVELNGKEIVKANLDRWTKAGQNPDGSHNKFPHAIGALPREGFIALQNYGATPVWFRNVQLKSLSNRQPQYTGKEPIGEVLKEPTK